MTGTVIIDAHAGSRKSCFPGPPSEFSNIQYAYGTLPESAARELSGDAEPTSADATMLATEKRACNDGAKRENNLNLFLKHKQTRVRKTSPPC